MEIVRYTFDKQKTTDILTSGKILVYFDEKVVKEKDFDEEGKEIGEHDAYSYQRVFVDALEKGAIVNAIVRLLYPQDAVEAIMRHKINGDPEAGKEFDAFNQYAEFAKTEADRIIKA